MTVGTSSLHSVAVEIAMGVGALLFAGIPTICVLAIVNILGGWRQSCEGDGTFRRLLWVSLVFALFEAVPILVSGSAYFLANADWASVLVFFVVIVTLANSFVLFRALRPRMAQNGLSKPLPLVSDPAFLARVEEISQKMGLKTPRVRFRQSLGASQDAQAWVEGLAAPTLIVTDGILERITTLERDSILAHELAHISNGSLWVLVAVSPVSAFTAVVIALFVPVWLATAFWLAIWGGLYRIASRFIEISCDRRAGGAIGYRETASALQKIHAIGLLRRDNWSTRLTFATATHPHLDTRLAALNRTAPLQERAAIAYSMDVVRRQRLLGFAAVTIWAMSILATLWAIWRPDVAPWACALLLAVILGPRVARHAMVRKFYDIEARRNDRRSARLKSFIGVAFLVGLGAVLCSSAFESYLIASWTPLVVVSIAMILVAWSLRTINTAEVLKHTRQALQARDFSRVLELGRANRKVVSRSPPLRHNVALACDLSGDRAGAIAQFEGLRRDRPRFALASFLLVSIYLDENEATRALEIARQLVRDLPQDPGAHCLLARATRRLGDLKQANVAIDRALALLPDSGDFTAIAAGVACDEGDYERARLLIRAAFDKAPGSAYVLVEAAKISVRTESAERGHEAIQQAIDAVRANRFAYLQYEIQQLKNSLALISQDQTCSYRRET